jgi:glycine cleavage system pyridoxal-binding protein P
MAMARRIGRSSADAFFVDADCHPQTLAVLRTRAGGLGLEVVTGDPFRDLEPASVFGALLHYPGSSGAVRDFRPVIQRLRDAQALAVIATDLLSLLLLASRASSVPTWRSAARSASACPWATADRTPLFSRPATRTSAPCPGA